MNSSLWEGKLIFFCQDHQLAKTSKRRAESLLKAIEKFEDRIGEVYEWFISHDSHEKAMQFPFAKSKKNPNKNDFFLSDLLQKLKTRMEIHISFELCILNSFIRTLSILKGKLLSYLSTSFFHSPQDRRSIQCQKCYHLSQTTFNQLLQTNLASANQITDTYLEKYFFIRKTPKLKKSTKIKKTIQKKTLLPDFSSKRCFNNQKTSFKKIDHFIKTKPLIKKKGSRETLKCVKRQKGKRYENNGMKLEKKCCCMNEENSSMIEI